MIDNKKIKKWVDMFLDHIDEITSEVHVEEEEGYKFKAVDNFQRNFDIDAKDLYQMLEQAIEDNNLVAGSWYFPRKMLLIFAEEYEKETREILKYLFDESKDVADRIDHTEDAFNNLMIDRNERLKEDSHSFIGLRFISLLLGYKFPEKYNPLKPREWRVFCKFIDDDFKIPTHTSGGEQYKIYQEYISALRNYIKDRPRIKDLRDQLTRGLSFEDKEFIWTTQDVIFVTAWQLASERSGEKETKTETVSSATSEEELVPGQVKLEFPLEEYLENLIVNNWNEINFGEPLVMYRDEDDTSGQQYVTDVGIIDILAKDANDNFVVIELKKGRTSERVVGQILNYMAWVRGNLANNNQDVRGLIIVSEGTQSLFSALSEVSDKVYVKYYKVQLDFVDPSN